MLRLLQEDQRRVRFPAVAAVDELLHDLQHGRIDGEYLHGLGAGDVEQLHLSLCRGRQLSSPRKCSSASLKGYDEPGNILAPMKSMKALSLGDTCRPEGQSR